MIKSRFFWIISVILVVVILTILSYKKGSVKVSPAYQTSTMDSLHLKHREKNNVKWELTSEKAILPVEKKEIHLQSLSLKINQSPAIYLTSGSGIYEIERGDVTLHNAVELKVKDSKFLTDTIKWHSRDEAIRTDDDVKFTGSNFLITGSGLAAKVKQQKVRILKDVKATFYR